MEKKKVFNEINSKGIIKVDMKDIKNLSIDDVMKQQLEKLEKDKSELETKLTYVAKKFDHLERAQRKYELTLLEKDAATAKDREIEAYNAMKEKIISHAKKEHDDAIKIRDRLQRIVPDYLQFVEKLKVTKHAEYEAARVEAEAKLAEAKKARVAEFIAKKRAEHEAAEQARIQQENEEKQKKLAEARLAAEQQARMKKYEQDKAQQEAEAEKKEYENLLAQEKSGKLTFRDGIKLKKLRARFEGGEAPTSPVRHASSAAASPSPAPFRPTPRAHPTPVSSSSPAPFRPIPRAHTTAAPARTAQDPERALYEDLLAQEKAGTLTFGNKVKLRKLRAKFE
ncbi:unnamed protein product [Ambrosiozyma monospora]|uniref:Unnamed protein product n=1 Tax=Ambrosiozyma monospora TaxID=43982 RepID=A0ACB5T992_AMBMO|nr:unnamed protein product [Ambrosiozyma monospora]